MQNHPGTLSSKSCSLASGQPSITAKATCFLNTSLALRCSPPTNATFSAPSCPKGREMNPVFTKSCPLQEAACVFSPGIPKLFHRATRWQLGQMVSAFRFFSHPPGNPGVCWWGSRTWKCKLGGELRARGPGLCVFYRGQLTWILWKHLVNISLREMKAEKHRQLSISPCVESLEHT